MEVHLSPSVLSNSLLLSSIEKGLFCFSGFNVDASKFFIFFLTLTLTSITATSQGFAVSSRLRVVAVAILLMTLSFVLFLVRDFDTISLFGNLSLYGIV